MTVWRHVEPGNIRVRNNDKGDIRILSIAPMYSTQTETGFPKSPFTLPGSDTRATISGLDRRTEYLVSFVVQNGATQSAATNISATTGVYTDYIHKYRTAQCALRIDDFNLLRNRKQFLRNKRVSTICALRADEFFGSVRVQFRFYWRNRDSTGYRTKSLSWSVGINLKNTRMNISFALELL